MNHHAPTINCRHVEERNGGHQAHNYATITTSRNTRSVFEIAFLSSQWVANLADTLHLEQILPDTMPAGKPSIDIATPPAWAQWLAQDADGTWWAYEHEPNEGAVSWYENEVGKSIRLEKQPQNRRWRETLRKTG